MPPIDLGQDLYFPSKRDWWIVALIWLGVTGEFGRWNRAIGGSGSILDRNDLGGEPAFRDGFADVMGIVWDRLHHNT